MSETSSVYEFPFQVIKDFLDDQKQTYFVDEQEHTCSLSFKIGGDQYQMAYWLTHGGELLQFSILFPNGPIAEKDRLGVAEIIVRANHSIEFGRLDMNMRTGEVRYYASHIIEEGYLGSGVLTRLTSKGIFFIEMYTTAIKRLLKLRYSPEVVIAMSVLELERAQKGYFHEEED